MTLRVTVISRQTGHLVQEMSRQEAIHTFQELGGPASMGLLQEGQAITPMELKDTGAATILPIMGPG